MLASRWSGENFSSRIWTDKRKLSNIIKTTIVSGIHQGLDVREMSRRINNVMSGGYKNAVRLVRTEMNFVNNQAAYDSFDECGILYYEFIAVLDNRTSKMCQSRDGEVYPMSEKSVGFNYPPLHPRCRSTVAPYIEGTGRLGSRIARVNGQRLHVSENMKYREFKEKYLTGGVDSSILNHKVNGFNGKIGNVDKYAKRHALIAEAEAAAYQNKVEEFKKREKSESDWLMALQKVNSGKIESPFERTLNCQRCAVAFEAYNRGYEVKARPSFGNDDPLRMAKNWLAAFKYSIDDLKLCRGATGAEILNNAEEIIRGFGEGARAIISFDWKDGTVGHVLVARCREGGIINIADPQRKLRSAAQMLKEAKAGTVLILRVDNLEFTDIIKNVV